MKTQTILAALITNFVFLTTGLAEVVLTHEKAVIENIDFTLVIKGDEAQILFNDEVTEPPFNFPSVKTK